MSVYAAVDVMQMDSNNPGEDRFCIRTLENHIKVFSVLDGHGGYLAVDLAASQLIDSIVDRLKDQPKESSNEDIMRIIETEFISLDESIFSLARFDRIAKGALSTSMAPIETARSLPQYCKAGCCVALVIVFYRTCFIAHVGDCRVLLLRECNHVQTDIASEAPESFGSESAASMEPIIKRPRSESELQRCAVGSYDLLSRQGVAFDTMLKVCDNRASTTASSSSEMYCTDNRIERMCLSVPRIKILPQSDHVKPSSAPSLSVPPLVPCLSLTALTRDHCCTVESERSAILSSCSDPHPFRPSENDRRRLGSEAPLRIAGSLAITRALGDAFLKVKDLSAPPYAPHVPYISCRPTVSYRTLSPADKAFILTSDGLWDYLSPLDCLTTLTSMMENRNTYLDYRDASLESIDSHHRVSRAHANSSKRETGNENMPQGSLASSHAVGQKKYPHSQKGVDLNVPPMEPVASLVYKEGILRYSSSNLSPPCGGKKADEINHNRGEIVSSGNISQAHVNAAEGLVNLCVQKASMFAGLTAAQLAATPCGQRRRAVLDDITVMIVHIAISDNV